MASVTISLVDDHSAEVLAAAKKQIANALEAIGGEAEKHAKEKCPVDTGRLRNSITFATKNAHGNPNGSGGERAKSSDYQRHSTPEENMVYVGTNVEYAEIQEYFGKKPHYLRNSLTQHTDDYKKIVEAALKD